MCIIVLIHIGTTPTPDVFTLNPHSGIPIYRQLREQVRRMVLSGQLRPGAELPSVRELAALHAVNPMTISKAYSLLEADGLLERNRGKPMTVAAQSRPQAHVSRRLAQMGPIAPRARVPPLEGVTQRPSRGSRAPLNAAWRRAR